MYAEGDRVKVRYLTENWLDARVRYTGQLTEKDAVEIQAFAPRAKAGDGYVGVSIGNQDPIKYLTNSDDIVPVH